MIIDMIRVFEECNEENILLAFRSAEQALSRIHEKDNDGAYKNYVFGTSPQERINRIVSEFLHEWTGAFILRTEKTLFSRMTEELMADSPLKHYTERRNQLLAINHSVENGGKRRAKHESKQINAKSSLEVLIHPSSCSVIEMFRNDLDNSSVFLNALTCAGYLELGFHPIEFNRNDERRILDYFDKLYSRNMDLRNVKKTHFNIFSSICEVTNIESHHLFLKNIGPSGWYDFFNLVHFSDMSIRWVTDKIGYDATARQYLERDLEFMKSHKPDLLKYLKGAITVADVMRG